MSAANQNSGKLLIFINCIPNFFSNLAELLTLFVHVKNQIDFTSNHPSFTQFN